MSITDEQVMAFCKAFLEAPEFATFKEKVLDGLEAADAAAWRPIEEAPKDGTKVNIWRENYTVLEAFWDVYLQKWLLDLGSHIGAIHYEPTHFRPLPEPPK